MNDEDRMTNAEDRTATLGGLLSAFVFCYSFDIRNSSFGARSLGALHQPRDDSAIFPAKLAG